MKKKYLITLLISIALLTLSGCQAVEKWFKNAKEEWIGLEMTVRTYDENSQRKGIPKKTHLFSKSPWVSTRLTMWALP